MSPDTSVEFRMVNHQFARMDSLNDSQTQVGFATFGGPQSAGMLGEVAYRALERSWYQKWFVHRRTRPEGGGGLDRICGRYPSPAPAPCAKGGGGARGHGRAPPYAASRFSPSPCGKGLWGGLAPAQVAVAACVPGLTSGRLPLPFPLPQGEGRAFRQKGTLSGIAEPRNRRRCKSVSGRSSCPPKAREADADGRRLP